MDISEGRTGCHSGKLIQMIAVEKIRPKLQVTNTPETGRALSLMAPYEAQIA